MLSSEAITAERFALLLDHPVQLYTHSMATWIIGCVWFTSDAACLWSVVLLCIAARSFNLFKSRKGFSIQDPPTCTFSPKCRTLLQIAQL